MAEDFRKCVEKFLFLKACVINVLQKLRPHLAVNKG